VFSLFVDGVVLDFSGCQASTVSLCSSLQSLCFTSINEYFSLPIIHLPFVTRTELLAARHYAPTRFVH
jgi:hypothetical protein